MFILIPLLSQPVAAWGTFTYTCFANTNNTPSGPTATASCPPPYYLNGTGPNSAAFQCNYTFIDSKPGGQGSWHKFTLTVTPPGAPVGQVSSGWVFISAGGPAVISSRKYTYGPYGSPPPTGVVYLEVWCQDVQTQQTAYSSKSVTIGTG